MTNALMASLQPQQSADFPDIAPGDTVRVHQKIVEGRNERIQVFQGVVIAMRGGKTPGATYTVRRTAAHGVGVERTFPLYSTTVDKVEVLRKDTQVSYVDEPGSIFGEMSCLLDMPYTAQVKALSDVKAYVIADGLAFMGSRPEIALEVAALLARRLYYTTTYLVDLQQQAAGRREDLDLVDKILAQLTQPEEKQKRSKKR